MERQFPPIPNGLVAAHPFAIDMLEAVTLHNPNDMCTFNNFQLLFMLTDFECIENDGKDFLLVCLSDRDQ